MEHLENCGRFALRGRGCFATPWSCRSGKDGRVETSSVSGQSELELVAKERKYRYVCSSRIAPLEAPWFRRSGTSGHVENSGTPYQSEGKIWENIDNNNVPGLPEVERGESAKVKVESKSRAGSRKYRELPAGGGYRSEGGAGAGVNRSIPQVRAKIGPIRATLAESRPSGRDRPTSPQIR